MWISLCVYVAISWKHEARDDEITGGRGGMYFFFQQIVAIAYNECGLCREESSAIMGLSVAVLFGRDENLNS